MSVEQPVDSTNTVNTTHLSHFNDGGIENNAAVRRVYCQELLRLVRAIPTTRYASARSLNVYLFFADLRIPFESTVPAR